MVAGGGFGGDYTGATLLNNIGQRGGTKWTGYGLGTNAAVTALAGSGSTLYAGGGFTAAGSLVVKNIARFSGGKWSPLGSGTVGSGGSCAVSATVVGICTMTIDPATGHLYVGGSFTAINGVPANNVAVWNGKAWKAVGGGTDGLVNFLAIMDGVLYAGGRFGHADGNPADDLAQWPLSGGPWSALPGDPAVAVGSGNAWQDDVNSLTPITTVFSDHCLAIGGGFLDFTGTAVCGLVLYDATAATPTSYSYYGQDTGTTPGVGPTGSVLTTSVDGTDLYVGGSFTIAGGHSASDIAVLHFGGTPGNFWGTPGQVTGSQVSSITKVGSSLYLAGAFTAAGGVAAANVISYTPGAGTPWTKLSSGVGGSSDILYTLWQGSAGLYAGGRCVGISPLEGGLRRRVAVRRRGDAVARLVGVRPCRRKGVEGHVLGVRVLGARRRRGRRHTREVELLRARGVRDGHEDRAARRDVEEALERIQRPVGSLGAAPDDDIVGRGGIRGPGRQDPDHQGTQCAGYHRADHAGLCEHPPAFSPRTRIAIAAEHGFLPLLGSDVFPSALTPSELIGLLVNRAQGQVRSGGVRTGREGAGEEISRAQNAP